MYPAETTLPSLGVNVPSLAINTHLSFDFLHYEDSLIDSVHLIRAGTENLEKIFIIISRRDTSKCMAEVVSEIKRLRRRHAGSRSVWGDPKCNLPLKHRNVVRQNGDCIYVYPFIPWGFIVYRCRFPVPRSKFGSFNRRIC